jgi:hypothetical protein
VREMLSAKQVPDGSLERLPDGSLERHPSTLGAMEGTERPRLWIWLALVLVAAMVAGVSAFLVQERRLASVRRELSGAETVVVDLGGRTATLEESLRVARDRIWVVGQARDGLQTRVRGLERRLTKTRGRIALLREAREELLTRGAELRQEVSRAEGRLAVARYRMVTLIGPRLPDGQFVGRLRAVAPHQDPPRIAMHLRSDLRGEPLDAPGWRLVAVDPGTMVRLTTGRGSGSKDAALVEFARGFNGGGRWNAHLRRSLYWITVEDGLVTEIGQYRAR